MIFLLNIIAESVNEIILVMITVFAKTDVVDRVNYKLFQKSIYKDEKEYTLEQHIRSWAKSYRNIER